MRFSIGILALATFLMSCSPDTAERTSDVGEEGSADALAQPVEINAVEEFGVASKGYVMCIAPGMNRPEQFCGNRCPSGYKFVSYNPNTPAKCESSLQDGCEKIANLHYDLGWSGGHKTNFCKARGYDGVTNRSGSSYKGNGGGWCYKGDRAACTASLPRSTFAPATLAPGYDVDEAISAEDITEVSKQVVAFEPNDDLPTGRCRIVVYDIKQCFNAMTQRACYKTASNLGGVADWAEGESCP